MEKVLFNSDLFNYIVSFIPKIYCLYLHRISKDIREIICKYKCKLCDADKIFLPIEIYNNLYCYDCVNNFFIFSRKIYKEWNYLDRCKKKPYLNCKYCNIKCANSEFAHYHYLYKCKKK